MIIIRYGNDICQGLFFFAKGGYVAATTSY
jgi:hypothetical protein